jgi:hypothetical protein
MREKIDNRIHALFFVIIPILVETPSYLPGSITRERPMTNLRLRATIPEQSLQTITFNGRKAPGIIDEGLTTKSIWAIINEKLL